MNRALFTIAIVALGVLAASAHAQDADAGQAVFKSQCGICHSPLPGKNGVGPSLFNIVGRTAGQMPGFRYSAANKASAEVWTPETLNRYLTAPRVVIPGTIMTYAGLSDASKRANLIAYLATLK